MNREDIESVLADADARADYDAFIDELANEAYEEENEESGWNTDELETQFEWMFE